MRKYLCYILTVLTSVICQESSQVSQGNTYGVLLTTGDLIGAGTDGDVYITLYWADGSSSQEIYLDNVSINDFERGNTDEFKIDVPNTAPITYIKIKYVPKSLFDNTWHMNKILINDTVNGIVNEFSCQCWMGSSTFLVKTMSVYIPTTISTVPTTVSTVPTTDSTVTVPTTVSTDPTTDSTVTTTDQTISTVDETKNAECICDCQKSKYDHLTEDEFQAEMEKLKQKIRNELLVNRKNISKVIRKKISAPDDRKSSQSAGFIAAIFIFSLFLLVFISDVPFILKQLRFACRNKKSPCAGFRKVK